MGDDRYQLAYQESLRAISDQQQVIDGLQSRAGIVVSAAAVVLSVALAQLTQSTNVTIGMRVALLVYVGIAGSTGYVLWPRRKWKVHFQISDLHWSYIEGPKPTDVEAMHRDLGLYLDRYFVANAIKVDRMAWALTGSLALLLVASATLLYDLWSS